MTPEARADQLLSDWTSNNFLHQAAKPTLKTQIVKAIEEMMLLENRECAKALKDLEGFGPYSRQVAIETIRSRYDTEWEV